MCIRDSGSTKRARGAGAGARAPSEKRARAQPDGGGGGGEGGGKSSGTAAALKFQMDREHCLAQFRLDNPQDALGGAAQHTAAPRDDGAGGEQAAAAEYM